MGLARLGLGLGLARRDLGWLGLGRLVGRSRMLELRFPRRICSRRLSRRRLQRWRFPRRRWRLSRRRWRLRRTSLADRMTSRVGLAAHLGNILSDATIPELPNHYRGKVRDNYDVPDGRRIIIATDRLSAFDRIITAIPCKGQVLTQIARFWFDTTRDVCPNHVIEYPDPNVVLCRRLAILPVEIVVRDYLTGTTGTSIWPMYRAGRREIYGMRFPDGLRENQKLPATIITPTTKAVDGSHDEPLTPGDIIGRGLLTSEQWREVSELALALFARGREIAAERGLILVDTKYEFGSDASGRIILGDEIHTPDSSRYWIRDNY